MAYADYIRLFAATDAGTIVASNALDGVQSGFHVAGFARELLEPAYLAGGVGDALAHDEFFRLAGDKAMAGPPYPHLGHWTQDQLDLTQHPDFTIVWPASALDRLPSEDDHQRFARVLGTVRGVGVDWWELLGDLPPSERWFRPGVRAQFGQTFVWLTCARSLEAVLNADPGTDRTPADTGRDSLALIHHQPQKPQKWLAALTLPGALLRRRMSGRPSFVEATSHSRFAFGPRPATSAPNPPFGQTIDLRHFADTGDAVSCLPERVTMPFGVDDFLPEEVVRFRVLGVVSVARGQSTGDGTSAFARLLRGGRTPPQLAGGLL